MVALNQYYDCYCLLRCLLPCFKHRLGDYGEGHRVDVLKVQCKEQILAVASRGEDFEGLALVN